MRSETGRELQNRTVEIEAVENGKGEAGRLSWGPVTAERLHPAARQTAASWTDNIEHDHRQNVNQLNNLFQKESS